MINNNPFKSELKYRAYITPWGNADTNDMIYIPDGELHVYFGNYERGGYKDAVFQQCIGIKDRNGNDIYVGDILYNNVTSLPVYHVVYWNKINARFQLQLVVMHNKAVRTVNTLSIIDIPNKMTVIGNILENKDLLNDSHKHYAYPTL